MPHQANALVREQSSTEFLSNATITAIAWVGLFEANAFMFESFIINANVSWVFLPAAIRILAVLLAGSAGVTGLFIGSIYLNLSGENTLLIDAISLSIISAASPLIGIKTMSKWIHLSPNLRGLTWQHILALASAGAVFSVFGTQFYLAFSKGFESYSTSWWPMLVGDLVGTLIVLYAVSLIAKVTRKIRPN